MIGVGHGPNGPSVSIWNTNGNLQKSSTLKNYNPQHVAFTPTGQSLVAVSVGKFLEMKLTGAASASSSTFNGGCCAMAPDGSFGGWSNPNNTTLQLRQWDPKLKSVAINVGRIHCLALSPGGKWMATGGAERDVQLWDLNTKVRTVNLTGLPTPPTMLTFAGDGHTLAALAADGVTIHVWDLARNNATRRQFAHNRGAVTTMSLSPDGKLLATIGLDGKAVMTWNVATRDLTHKGPPLKLTAKELAELWNGLSEKDYVKADAAWHQLAAAGDNAVPFLKEKIWPTAVPKVDMTKIAKWVADLDAGKFALREVATKELMSAGEMAIVPLENVLKNPPSEEAALRAKMVLKQIARPVLTPERLRALEVIELLEAMRTAQAVAVLQEIGRDSQITQIRTEAEHALKRIADTKAEK
jgi:WD40 repeat protein